MSIEELKTEKEQIEHQIKQWKAAENEARNVMTNANQQVLMYIGHLERVDLWINKLKDKSTETNN